MDEYAREIEHHVPYRDARRKARSNVNAKAVNKTITWLTPEGDREWFPPLEQALDEPEGLLAAGGDLSPPRLLAAYRRGIFPWYSAGQPVLWWSPDPREVLFPAEFRCSRSLAKTLRNRGFEVTFRSRLRGGGRCLRGTARTFPGTWITPEMRAAYCELHRARPCPQRRSAAGRRAGGRAVRRARSDAYFSANRCSAGSATLPKSRSRAWWSAALWRDSNSSTASYLHRICAPWGQQAIPRTEFSALVAQYDRRARRRHVCRDPENCSPEALFWQNSPPSRVPQVTDVERRCDSDGRRSRRDFA